MKLLRRLSPLGASLLLTLVFATSVFGLTPASASAATVPSSAMASQMVQQQISSLLKQAPGGKLIAWNQVSYDQGRTIITVRPLSSTHTQSFSSSSYCNPNSHSGWYCLFWVANFLGWEVDSSSERCQSPGSNPPLYLANYFNGYIGVDSFTNNSNYDLTIYTTTGNHYYAYPGWSVENTGQTYGTWDLYYHAYKVYAC